jgi:hypothetical protein
MQGLTFVERRSRSLTAKPGSPAEWLKFPTTHSGGRVGNPPLRLNRLLREVKMLAMTGERRE